MQRENRISLERFVTVLRNDYESDNRICSLAGSHPNLHRIRVRTRASNVGVRLQGCCAPVHGWLARRPVAATQEMAAHHILVDERT